MTKSRISKIAVAVGFFVATLSMVLVARAAPGPRQPDGPGMDPYNLRPTAQADQRLFDLVPSYSLFCLRINNFEYTLRELDGFLTGILPIPMGLSMGVRMQLAGLLGNPQLGGVDMNGSFVFFVTAPPTQVDPDDPMAGVFFALMIPVTDYGQFISSNPACGQPDAQGISQIKTDKMPGMIVAQAANYAVITGGENAQQLAEPLKLVTSGRSPGLASILDRGEADLAVKDPVWLYVNVKQAVTSFGPAAEQQLPMLQMMVPGMSPLQTETPSDAGAFGFDVKKMIEENQIDTLTMSLIPTRDQLTLGAAIIAVPGSEMAETFAPGSPAFLEIIKEIGAGDPRQMGPELDAVKALLPLAGQADYVGMVNLMDLANIMEPGTPGEAPKVGASGAGGLAFALKAVDGRLYVDAALSKQHLSEAVKAFTEDFTESMTSPPTIVIDDQPPDVTEVSPTTVEQPEDFFPDVSPVDTVTVAGQGGPVRIGGVRLVRQSDYQAGIVPLGRNAGYTLALIMDLPEPAVRISGGEVTKASTDSGKSLLPAADWDRKIKLARLSRDKRTVVFEVELALPDENARGLAEVSGTLKYLSGQSARQVDLGVMKFEAGAKGSNLGALVESVETDPWHENATVVALKLNRVFEAVKSVQLFAEDGAGLNASLLSERTVGAASMLTIAVDRMPPSGKIVLEVYQGFQSNEIPFRVSRISLTGEPML